MKQLSNSYIAHANSLGLSFSFACFRNITMVTVFWLVFLHVLLVVVNLVASPSAIHCLKGFMDDMTYYSGDGTGARNG